MVNYTEKTNNCDAARKFCVLKYGSVGNVEMLSNIEIWHLCMAVEEMSRS